MKQCHDLGHNWKMSPDTHSFECSRCHLLKFGPNGAGNWLEEAEPDEDLDEAELALMCLWCGKRCNDHDALELHEDECAP